MIYLNKEKNNFSICLRDLEERDISWILDYWYGESPEFFHAMGIDMDKFPDREQRSAFFLNMIGNKPKKDPSFLLVAECNNIPVGYILFNCIKPGVEAQAHVHITNHKYRSCGYASAFFVDTLSLFPNIVEVNKFIMEPCADNRPVNGFLKSFGLSPLKSYLKPAQGICREMIVNRYEIKKWEILLLHYVASTYRKIKPLRELFKSAQ